MGIMDKVKGAIFEPDEPERATAPAANTATPAITIPQPPMSNTYGVRAGSARPEIMAMIRQEVFQRQPTKYTQLLDMAEKMKAAIPDEATRLKAAIPVVGVTLAELKDAISRHSQALVATRTNFAAKAEQKRKSTIDSKKDRRTAIAARTDELEAELAKLRQEDMTLAGQIAQDEVAHAQTEADFKATADAVEQELTQLDMRVATLF